ncbi:MAG TPA: TauD/TfdA family dioxygenase, partial [Rugosimonospora sp.]|nr:TauD/TfdA family dioxygenase [Rugosimonospora sp.]
MSNLRIDRVAGHIGAEVTGVDLSTALDDDTVAAIRAALLAHKVVFFRGQHLDHGQQIASGRAGHTRPPDRRGRRRPGPADTPHPSR